MSYQTGDIAINTSWPGHVMMVLEEHQNENKILIIHGQKSGNFHIQSQQYESGNNHAIGYLIDAPTWVFRPPWERYTAAQIVSKKRELNEIARAIARSAKYGVYRAVRLFAGSSEYGPDARSRLAKYHMRKAEFLAGGNGKFVSTISCAEAVILCYQLTFFGTEQSPLFIKKDAAHTMPNTLKDYLERNWSTVKRGN